MQNKVVFNYDELFLSVGLDVGADFTWMSIALHDSLDSLELAVSKIKEAEELYSL